MTIGKVFTNKNSLILRVDKVQLIYPYLIEKRPEYDTGKPGNQYEATFLFDKLPGVEKNERYDFIINHINTFIANNFKPSDKEKVKTFLKDGDNEKSSVLTNKWVMRMKSYEPVTFRNADKSEMNEDEIEDKLRDGNFFNVLFRIDTIDNNGLDLKMVKATLLQMQFVKEGKLISHERVSSDYFEIEACPF